MTGFGNSETNLTSGTLKIEIKSLNSKFLDLNLKLPKELSTFESHARSTIQDRLKRGKINVVIELLDSGDEPKIAINERLLKAYFERYQTLSKELNTPTEDLFRLALQAPEVLSTTSEPDIEIETEMLSEGLHAAIDECSKYRNEEGEALAEKLTNYIQSIQVGLTKVGELDPGRVDSIKERISKNLDDIRSRIKVDENRFEQELIYYIEKLDITEERVRLSQHLNYFLETMSSTESEGKKLGFICQEIGREINTIGSKANDSGMQQVVVEMKDELEKIKEQLLNIL